MATGALLLAALLYLFVQYVGGPPSASGDPSVFTSDASASEPSAQHQFFLEQAASDALTRQVLTLLEAPFGADRVEAMVRAEINFEEYEEIVKEFAAPHGESGVVRSERRIDERVSEDDVLDKSPAALKGLLTVGPPSAGDAHVVRNERVFEYELNEIESRRQIPPGAIKRLSVAVLIDGELSAEQETMVAKTLTSALGLDLERGDQLHVDSISFAARSNAGSLIQSSSLTQWLQSPVAIWIGATVLLLSGLLITVARRGRGSFDREGAKVHGHREEAFASEIELSPEERRHQDIRVKVLSVAKEKPDNIARLLRSWMTEE